jgi:hypothetical protein
MLITTFWGDGPLLKERLERIKEKVNSHLPEESIQIMNDATDRLEQEGIADRAHAVGDRAPEFSLDNTEGQTVSLQQLTSDNPVVLTFYRGKW